MRICVVEDSAAIDLEPLTSTRPSFEILLGATTLADKFARAFGASSMRRNVGVVVRPHLADIVREAGRYAAVNERDWLARGPVVVANGRWVPPPGFQDTRVNRPLVGLCKGRPACAWVGPGQAVALELHGVDAWFEELTTELEAVELGGEWVDRPWDIVAKNASHIALDFATSGRCGIGPRQLPNAAVVGPCDRLFIDESARVDPYTVFDTTGGPITIAAGVWVQPFTRVEGPCYIGKDTQLFRANVRGGTTIGPNCRIGGEVEASIVHGFSNKYHEGFLGHAYIGEWVNLGAITSNSDLRNDYGEVYVPIAGDPVATGQAKVGCFVGDHTRTGLGSMLNTGTSIGVMCNVLPAGLLLPKHIPSFCSVLYGRVAPGFSLDQLFATARVVKGRRGQEFTATEEQLFLELFERTRLQRERAFQKANDRRNDGWPLLSARL
jgi:UDP-N-acetylglucosamine diphosphorylase / glucose-1-phosphate thymidylyltransferase / UDP-N-acetylgalactosamine diphosphorylase / glucosamine-1-phosphate N-acetyltransferase / galactosamine-1-phosphate N-acetyltransferase